MNKIYELKMKQIISSKDKMKCYFEPTNACTRNNKT